MATTRAQLRRLIGRMLQQHFFKKMGSSSTATSNGTTTTLIDSTLAQADNYWNRYWIYFPAVDVVREISSFTASTDTLTWLEPVSGTSVTASGVTYELWSQFTAKEVNDAISNALGEAWPWFFRVTEGYLVIQNDVGARYSLSGLSPTPRWLAQVWKEDAVSSVTGTVTSAGTSSQLIDSTKTFTSADIGKQVRIYDGTSQGDFRTVSGASGNTLTVSVAFTSTLDTTSKYRLVDNNEETRCFVPLTAWNTDREDNPTTLVMGGHLFGWEGFLYKLVYASDVADMTTESSEVAVPQQWLVWAVLEQLYFTKMVGSAASEESVWGTAYNVAKQKALQLAVIHKQHFPDGTIQNLSDFNTTYDLEYPF